MIDGEIAGVQILEQGSGYETAPKVRFTANRGPGKGAKGTALISNGAVVGVNITHAGSGYIGPPVV